MSLRESLAVGWAPVFLRLALGVMFIWAGLAKVMHRVEFTGADAATLANYGVIAPPGAMPTPEPTPEPTMEPAAFYPAGTLQDGGEDEDGATQDGGRDDNRMPDGSPPPPLDDDDQLAQPVSPGTGGPAADPGPGYTAAQFPGEQDARALHNITLLLHNAMRPGTNADGEQTIALWFDVDASRDYDPWPVYFAWAVAITELVGGGLLLIGLLTRLSALGIAGTMVGAIWLTTIGPAIQSGDAALGFLPNQPMFDLQLWMTPLIQLTLLLVSIAVVCAGSGALAIDRLLFGNPFFYKGGEKKADS